MYGNSPDLRSENSDGKEEILSGALGGNPKKLTPEEVAAEGRIRKSNDAPIQVQPRHVVSNNNVSNTISEVVRIASTCMPFIFSL